ncbi:adenylate/guanylate cyclase domain-containing protein [Magnetococcus sp. PR-3]|uniref:adenylate/guanylate cyclase domain-containing protein n=1 Tax=Magnetococcus sp. PR-3 TaxID=3120355 RepID=UPI002FCE55DA
MSASIPLVLNGHMRIKLHGLAALAALFLTFYGKQVCPFIDKVTLLHLFSTLVGIFFIQVLLREWVFRTYPTPPPGQTSARHFFRLSVITWFFTGILACVVTWQVYGEAFHWSSYPKLLAGYWALGAGLLSQLEYIMVEQHLRRTTPNGQGQERITVRLMEAFAAFTIVPALVMTLMSFRFVYEGYIDKAAAFEVLFLAICFVAAALFVSWRYGRALHRDCDALTEAVNEIAHGRFGVKVDSSRADELGIMAHGINEMGQGLVLRERIRDAFGRFVNPEVAESFIQRYAQEENHIQMGGERKEVTILIADLRSFTPLSESMDPEDLTELLNGYMSAMVRAIQHHGGMVDKFIGDAVLAVFGLSDQKENAPLQAVRAAQAMRAELVTFNVAQQFKDRPILENGIGIHCGEVVAGYIGSTDRLEFTVIGHNVNVTARIESLCKTPNPPILFSHPVAEAIQTDIPVREITTASLKGVTEQITLYSVFPENRHPEK